MEVWKEYCKAKIPKATYTTDICFGEDGELTVKLATWADEYKIDKQIKIEFKNVNSLKISDEKTIEQNENIIYEVEDENYTSEVKRIVSSKLEGDKGHIYIIVTNTYNMSFVSKSEPEIIEIKGIDFKTENITLYQVDSFYEMKELLQCKEIIFCEEEQNSYAAVGFGNYIVFGMAYYNYGIEPIFNLDRESGLCYIATGENLILFDFNNEKILFNEKLFTVILDVINIRKDVYVLCDLELICYSEKKEKWSTAFRDIVTNYELLDNERLWLDCDGRQLIINLQDGTVE